MYTVVSPSVNATFPAMHSSSPSYYLNYPLPFLTCNKGSAPECKAAVLGSYLVPPWPTENSVNF
jgi:hypothetical protein